MRWNVLDDIERYSIRDLVDMQDEQLADLSKQVDQAISHVMVIRSWLRGAMIIRQAERADRGGK
jgi:hypothetical protein